MKKATYVIKLKKKDQERIKRSLKAGTDKARVLTRCRILLLSNQSMSNKEISKVLEVCEPTIIAIKKRYLYEGLDAAIHEQPRSGAPKKFQGLDKAKITAIACSQPPKGHARWTFALLAHRVVELKIVDKISSKTIERLLKKTS